MGRLIAAAAGSGGVALWVAIIALAGGVVSTAASFYLSRRKAKDDTNLGVLTLGQQSLIEALKRANDENLHLRKELQDKQTELKIAIAEVADLRHRLEGL